MIPIPADDDTRINPQVRFFEFLDRESWIEVFQAMSSANQKAEENELYASCQAVMAEVGYQHTVRARIVEALEPDSGSADDIVSAIEDLRRREPQPRASEEGPAPSALSVADVELAVQQAVSRVEVAPKDLPVALFLDLCREIAMGIVGEGSNGRAHGVSETSGTSGDSGDIVSFGS